MRRPVSYFIFVFLFSSIMALPSHAAKRVALVIGNSAYEHAAKLTNPKNDAEAMAAALAKVGFDVIQGVDLSHVDFAQTVSTFRTKLRGADVGLLFYAGHGLQVDGQNYLMPIDAKLGDETSLEFEAVSLGVILKLMERETKTNLVFLDACRDNPLARNLARSMGTRSASALGRGLARVESGLGTLVSFATQPGNVALDGEGKNSPFATGMLKHLETPGLDVELVMRRVREDVIKSTGGSQVPWSNSSLTGSFIFKDKPRDKKIDQTSSTPSKSGVDPLAVEMAFWQAAKDAGTLQVYEAYLKKYPKGSFAPLATIHLAEIEKAAAAELKRKTELDAAKMKKAAAEKALQSAETEKRQKELAALEQKQAEERKKLARERDELAERLKALEENAKKSAKAKQEKEQQVASLQPSATVAAPLLDEHTMALVLQNELRRVGCNPGKVDGVWGNQGSGALKKFNQHASLNLPADVPTMDAIKAVKSKTDRVCPPDGSENPAAAKQDIASTLSGRAITVEKEFELTFWKTIQNSDTIAAYESYLKKYPDGSFTSLANLKIEELKKPKPKQATTTISPSARTTQTARPSQPSGGNCKSGNMAACKNACSKGYQKACNRYQRGY